MPRIPAFLSERALGMLQGGMRTADVARAVTPGTHNPSISAQTVRNRLREAGLSACRPVVRQVLTRHYRQQYCLWAQTHHRWIRQEWQKVLFINESRFCGIDLEVEDPSWSGAVSQHHRTELVVIAGNLNTCATGKTSSSLMWYPSYRLILT
uniref:Transposase Tc1-like domain-containing protein n=1 Tax=Oncorhynchus tshawytscha TaxID=74940 RepID=A0AAZ3PPR7_ONCTS